ncbi:unnamed protein product [Ectocarpus sp. 4 AP-2014]
MFRRGDHRHRQQPGTEMHRRELWVVGGTRARPQDPPYQRYVLRVVSPSTRVVLFCCMQTAAHGLSPKVGAGWALTRLNVSIAAFFSAPVLVGGGDFRSNRIVYYSRFISRWKGTADD